MTRDPFDLLPDAVVVVDDRGCVRTVNDRAAAVLGLTAAARGELLTSVLELRDAGGRPCPVPPPPPTVGDRMAERIVTVVGRGDRRPVALTGRWDGEGWTLVFRPAGRRLASERRQGDVVATVSHEIRSPLASVKGFTRTLLSRWDRFSDEQRLAMLETIDADADRVTRLLLDLLEVSRIDADRVQLRRASVDVGALAQQVVDRAARSDEADGRALSVAVGDEVPRIDGDADRLEQVLTNLVDNALRHGLEGDIVVTVDVLHSGGDPGIEVVVVDEGPGVPPDLAQAIFEKFGRGRETRRAGTGLGLYITRGLVQAHGGTVALEPSDRGARFVVRLPARG